MVFVEGDDYRTLRRPGGDPAQFRSLVRLPRTNVADIAVVDGLAAWYRFEDSSTTAIDYTAKLDDDRFADTTAFDGIVTGASFLQSGGVTDVVSGQNPSGAYDLDGVDDRIILGDTGQIQGQQSWTLSAFIKPETLGIGFIFANGFDGNVHPAHISLTSNGTVRVRRFDGSQDDRVFGPTVPAGAFTHIGVTHDGNDTISFYKNGNKQSDKVFSISGQTNNAQDNIGAIFNNGSIQNFFEGVIDDFRIYTRSLSASEHNQIYTNTDSDQ
jgi:hypothetical protein